jgi:hypothetical protein
MAKQNEPDGDPDVGDGIKRLTEAPGPKREPHANPDIRDGLRSLSGSGGQQDR